MFLFPGATPILQSASKSLSLSVMYRVLNGSNREKSRDISIRLSIFSIPFQNLVKLLSLMDAGRTSQLHGCLDLSRSPLSLLDQSAPYQDKLKPLPLVETEEASQLQAEMNLASSVLCFHRVGRTCFSPLMKQIVDNISKLEIPRTA